MMIYIIRTEYPTISNPQTDKLIVHIITKMVQTVKTEGKKWTDGHKEIHGRMDKMQLKNE